MSRLATAFLAACVIGLNQVPAHAQAISDDVAPTRAISVPKDKSVAFRLSPAAAEVVVAQPKVAQIVANNNNSIYIRGQDMGSTNILVYDKAHRLLEVVDVNVGFDAAAAQSAINRALPNDRIVVTGLASGLLLSGEVPNSGDAARALAIAERYAPKAVTSELMIAASQQIMLEVRIVEANRTAMKQFGMSLDVESRHLGGLSNALVPLRNDSEGIISGLYDKQTPTGRLGLSTNIGNTTIDVVLDTMEDKGLVRTLARPNLAAISGEEASFLAGGEYPYKVTTGLGTESTEFKPFGVQLKFTPVVEANGQIRLKVAPEVSALDFNTGTDVPGLTVRRTSTTVELRDGETFAIAGLFQQDYLNNARQVPGLGDIPVLGALFKSTRWQRRETELVVLVTPRLVTSSESIGLSPDPLKVSNEPSAIDVLLDNKTFDQPIKAPIEGPTGGLRGPLK